MAQVRIEDHMDEVKALIEDSIITALELTGVVVEGDAVEELSKPKPHKTEPSPRPNVDTGRLRNSIVHAVNEQEKSVKIGSALEYAPYLEFGTSRMRAYPYLKPALEMNKDTLSKAVAKAMQAKAGE